MLQVLKQMKRNIFELDMVFDVATAWIVLEKMRKCYLVWASVLYLI